MLEAHTRNVKAGRTDFFSIDGGYGSNRNSHCCTMPAHGEGGAIVAFAHARLTTLPLVDQSGVVRVAPFALRFGGILRLPFVVLSISKTHFNNSPRPVRTRRNRTWYFQISKDKTVLSKS